MLKNEDKKKLNEFIKSDSKLHEEFINNSSKKSIPDEFINEKKCKGCNDCNCKNDPQLNS